MQASRAPGRKDATPWHLWHHGERKSGRAKSLTVAPSVSLKALSMYKLTRKLRGAKGTWPPLSALQRLILPVTVTSSFHSDSQETGTLYFIHNFQDHISFSQVQNRNNCFHRLSKSHYLQNDFLNFIMKNIIDYLARKYQPGVPHPKKVRL